MAGAFVRLGDGLIGLEGAVDHRTDEFAGGTDVRTWPITASLIVRPLPIVFAAAGLGWYNTTVDYAGDALDDQTETNMGVSIRSRCPIAAGAHAEPGGRRAVSLRRLRF